VSLILEDLEALIDSVGACLPCDTCGGDSEVIIVIRKEFVCVGCAAKARPALKERKRYA
jgi:hypothetical protein